MERVSIHNSEKGQALAELAVVIPALFVIWLAMVDVGRMLNNYMMLTQIVREGTRLASGLNDLGSAPNAFIAGSTTEPNHLLIQDRVNFLIGVARTQKNLNIDNNFVIETEHFSTLGQAGTNERVNTVRVNVQTNYDAIFPLFNNMTISVSEIASHLQGS